MSKHVLRVHPKGFCKHVSAYNTNKPGIFLCTHCGSHIDEQRREISRDSTVTSPCTYAFGKAVTVECDYCRPQTK